LDGKEEQILNLMRQGETKRGIARKFKVSYGTIHNFFKTPK